jgi:hypothetical protein
VSLLQPLCDPCWERRSPGVYCLANHGAVRLCPEDRRLERCALCGKGTLCGLWVLLEAGEARYPHEERCG